MTTLRRLGLLGGTFDPVHVGHVAAAEAVREVLSLDEVWLMTSHLPPHRPQPAASVHHRFAMVALAVQDSPQLRASDFELLAPGPSYTSATLSRLHASGLSPSQLFFIVGADAFAEVATWREYPRFLDAAHFVVVNRGDREPGFAARMTTPADRRVTDAQEAVRSGSIDGAPSILLVDHSTPDVSSTRIRERCGRGLPIAGLVAPAVERHIQRHRLYASADGTPVERLTHLLHEQEHL